MYITCNCLNVTIRTRGNDFKPANLDDFGLNPIERDDLFFRKELATLTDFKGINKEQSGLVEVRNVGPWIVYFCRNCCQYTHAIHEEHGTANVIVNTCIITSVDKVRKLKAYPQWSPVFGIVIRYKPSDGDPLELPCDSAGVLRHTEHVFMNISKKKISRKQSFLYEEAKSSKKLDAAKKHPDYKSQDGFLSNRDGNTNSYRCAGRKGRCWGCPGCVKEDATGNVTVLRTHNHAVTCRERIEMQNEMINLAQQTTMSPREIFNQVCKDPRFSNVSAEFNYESVRSSIIKTRSKYRRSKLTEKLSDIGICNPSTEDEPQFATILL